MTDAEVKVRTIADLTTGPKVVVDDILFDGLDVLRCYTGRFRFSFRDREPIELCPGETLVTYPGAYVTIAALEPENRIIYGIFEGTDVVRFFDGLGFFDLVKGRTSAHEESVLELAQRIADEEAALQIPLPQLEGLLKTLCAELRASCGKTAFDAFCAVDRGVRNGKAVTVGLVCASLGVSRAYLNRVFLEAAGLSPSAYIRRRQVQRVRRLMMEPDLRMADISRGVGIGTLQQFSAFVRRMTGYSPRALRLSLQQRLA